MIADIKEIGKIRGFLDDEEARFLNRLARKVVERFGNVSVFCEIGSFCGRSTVSIASALKEEGNGVLYAIDWHQGSLKMPEFGTSQYKSTYDEFVHNLEEYSVKEYVITIHERSANCVEKIPGQIHFLWIDGAHEEDSVEADFKNYSEKLAEGGYLLFHDACWTTWTGPFQVINKYVLDNENYNLYALIGNTMIFQRERNKVCKIYKNLLRKLCLFVSGEERNFVKKGISFILFRLTNVYIRFCHDWKR